MQIPDEIRLAIEIGGILGSAAVILTRLGRLGERFDNHGTKLEKLENAMDKMESTMEVLAVQKEQIQSLRDQQITNTKRTDDTFGRIFSTLERMQGSRPAT
jgi:hypothetical protein